MDPPSPPPYAPSAPPETTNESNVSFVYETPATDGVVVHETPAPSTTTPTTYSITSTPMSGDEVMCVPATTFEPAQQQSKPSSPSSSFTPLCQDPACGDNERIIGLITVLCGVLAIVLFTAVTLKDDIDYDNPYWQSNCTYMNNLTHYRCCDTIDCQCRECPLVTSCSVAVAHLLDEDCCGGSACCGPTVCETCPYTYYSSCCSYDRDGDCVGCYRTGYRDCNCRCSLPVAATTCHSLCGTCTRIDSHYIYHVNVSPEPSEVHQVQTYTCGRDNQACVDGYIARHSTDNPCWYNKNSASAGAVDYFPHHDLNAAAIVFEVLFGAIALVGGVSLFMSFQACVTRKLKERTHCWTDAWC